MASTIYHRGGNISWGDYLALQSQQNLASHLRIQHESLKEAYVHQSSQLQETIASIGSLEQALTEGVDNIVDSIESLHASFDYHLGFVISQLQEQNSRLARIGKALDSISDAVHHPVLMRAAEQREIGFDRKKVGLIDKALEAFLRAEQDNDTDFVVQFEIGLLYLYGRTPDCSVVNVDDAIRYLVSAARYSQAYIGRVPMAAEYCGQAFLHASIAKYVQANELYAKGDLTGSLQMTQAALEYAKSATEKHPLLDCAHYHVAKYAALLDQPAVLEPALVRAIKIDMLYAVKMFQDPDFAKHYSRLEEMSRRLEAEELAEARKASAKLKNQQKELSDWKCQQRSQVEVRSLIQHVDSAIASCGYISLARAVQISRGRRFEKLTEEVAARRKSLDGDRHALLAQFMVTLDQLSASHRRKERDEKSFQTWQALAKRSASCRFDNGIVANLSVEELHCASQAAIEELERVDATRQSSFHAAIGISRLLAVVLPLGLAYFMAQAYTVPAVSAHPISFSRMAGALIAPFAGIFIGLLAASLIRIFFDHEFEAGGVLVATGAGAVAVLIAYVIVAVIVALIMDISGAKDSIDTALWILLAVGIIIAWIPGFSTFCGKAIFHRNP